MAVASDSSSTWWNPGGLATGPLVDLAWAGNLVETTEQLPALRHRTSWFAVGTPPIGLSYYRFRITDIQPFDPTGQAEAGREELRAGVPVRSLSASQLGVTLVRTLVPGVHAGTTLKYVRGTLRHGREDSLAPPSDLLAQGEALDGGHADSRFDLDVGVLGIAGSLRLGAGVRNVREPEFGADGSSPDAPLAPMRLARQIRVGAAFDAEADTGVPLTFAFDADARAYATPSGARRMVALGAEHWFLAKRVGVRAGGRLNTRGARERSATAGLTLAMRAGLYLDGHAVRGGSADEKGWGLAARVSF
ncbi:MAG: conjugal transfer protein TraF [Acidobacteria bacterium]|nr:conjugal transfer protein TraF [Acidobacteriota bacterium]